MDWTEYYVNIAQQVKLKSKDPKTKIGSVIVGEDGEIVSTGYNSLPRGVDDNVQERLERPGKYKWMVHSELNAIINAARTGVSTKGCTIYITSDSPCTGCAKAIINAGIKKVVCDLGSWGDSATWREDLDLAIVMLTEAGVEICGYD